MVVARATSTVAHLGVRALQVYFFIGNRWPFPHLLSLDHLHSDQTLPDLDVSEGACLTWLRLALNFFTVLEIVSRDREFVASHPLSSSESSRNRFPVTTLVG